MVFSSVLRFCEWKLIFGQIKVIGDNGHETLQELFEQWT